LYQGFSGLKVSAEVFDLDLKSRFARQARVDVGPDAVVRAFVIPTPEDLSPTYFVRLKLEDAGGRELSRNFYWLAVQDDELDWQNTKWYYTPTSRHADLTALAKLPPTTLQATHDAGKVTVTNTGKALAFQVRLKLIDPATGDEALPVFWDDNYFELFPGETRTIGVSTQRPVKRPRIEVEAWNVTS
jgi:exo-1,4-beta-D-glucosaminidase